MGAGATARNGDYSGQGFADMNSTEQEQADFVPRFFELTKNLDKAVVIWGLLHDVVLGTPLDHAGLRRFSGEIKPAWNEWQKFAQRPVVK
jgi:hypothetical protein